MSIKQSSQQIVFAMLHIAVFSLAASRCFAQDPEVVAMRDTFCAVRSGAFYHLSKVGLVVAIPLPASSQPPIFLTGSSTTACDSPEAKAAKSVHFVPALRLDLRGGEGLIAIDVFGTSYWGGDWDTFLRKRAKERAAQAQREGALNHQILQELEPLKEARAPMIFMLESSTSFRRGRPSSLHSAIYYLRNGEYAIEVRAVARSRNLLPGAMSEVERGILCRSCQQL